MLYYQGRNTVFLFKMLLGVIFFERLRKALLIKVSRTAKIALHIDTEGIGYSILSDKKEFGKP